MTEQYSQTVEVSVSPLKKRMQIVGIICLLVALGFVISAVMISWFLMIGFGIFLVMGIVNLHFFNDTAKEYTYDFSQKRLVIAKCDIVNRRKRILNILFDDVLELSLMGDMLDENTDFLVCSNSYDEGVYQLVFELDGKNRRLIFQPDTYMLALLKQRLKERSKVQ